MSAPGRTRRRSDDYAVGYAKTPAASRFKPGQSGNLRGRPRGRVNALPYEAVLGQMVTIREEGRTRRVTAAEAFLLHMTKSGLAGDGAAARTALTAIETARAGRDQAKGDGAMVFVRVLVDPKNANPELRYLRMAIKADPFRPTARMLIEPWLVQEALARLGERRLTPDEQRTVAKATRTPHKVEWPAWWAQKPARPG